MKKIFVTGLLALILVLYVLRVYKVNTGLSVKEEVIPYATEREVILPYILSAFQFTPSEWQKLEDEEFYLSTSRYPVKTKWKMK